MERQMQWAKRQRKHFDYETKQKAEMKTIRLISIVAVVALLVFFWTDIKGTVKSISSAGKGKKETAVAALNEKTTPDENINVKKKWPMPGVLQEISGLSNIDLNRFACVQDELGKIFIYNTEKEAVEKEIDFGSPGDYEGLAVAGETAWVLRADGTLFEVANYASKPVVKEFRTHLTAEQNAEGLCFDKNRNRLLVAIKDEEPGNPGYKGIYGFDLATKKMAKEPVYKIDMGHPLLAGMEQKGKKAKTIKPSGITIHPATGELYITDGPKSKLLVMSKAGEANQLYQLDEKVFMQPEGITFNPDGELFISNEGARGEGNIVNLEIAKD